MPHAFVRSDFLRGLRHSGSGVNVSGIATDPGNTYVTGSNTGSATFGSTKYGYVESVADPTSLPETLVVAKAWRPASSTGTTNFKQDNN